MERAHRNSRRTLGLVAVPLGLASVVAAIAAGLVTGSGQAASALAPANTSPPTIAGTTDDKTLTAGILAGISTRRLASFTVTR